MTLSRMWAIGGLCLAAAGAAQTEAPPLGEVVARVQCLEDPAKSYAFYAPSYYRADQKWPLILFFEPAARAQLPIQLFAPAAERFGFIIACSYDTRNYTSFEKNWEGAGAMWNDLISRFPIDAQRMYAGGMSGGARLASRVAASTGKIAGLIVCGAGLWARVGDTPPPRIDLISTVGHLDFNYTELLELERELTGLGIRNRRLEFQGGHQWPPKDICFEALGWLQTIANKDGRAPAGRVFPKEQVALKERLAEQLEKAGAWLAAHDRRRHLVEDFGDRPGLAASAAAVASVEASAEHKQALRSRTRAERLEGEWRRKIVRRLNNRDAARAATGPQFMRERDWWDKEIGLLRKKAGGEDVYAANAAQRTLNAVGSICYEKSVYAFRQADYGLAALLNTAAEFASPQAPFPPFNLARAYAQLGQTDAAFAAIERCLAKGGARPRLRSEPLLNALKDDPRYGRLLGD